MVIQLIPRFKFSFFGFQLISVGLKSNAPKTNYAQALANVNPKLTEQWDPLLCSPIDF